MLKSVNDTSIHAILRMSGKFRMVSGFLDDPERRLQVLQKFTKTISSSGKFSMEFHGGPATMPGG